MFDLIPNLLKLIGAFTEKSMSPPTKTESRPFDLTICRIHRLLYGGFYVPRLEATLIARQATSGVGFYEVVLKNQKRSIGGVSRGSSRCQFSVDQIGQSSRSLDEIIVGVGFIVAESDFA